MNNADQPSSMDRGKPDSLCDMVQLCGLIKDLSDVNGQILSELQTQTLLLSNLTKALTPFGGKD